MTTKPAPSDTEIHKMTDEYLTKDVAELNHGFLVLAVPRSGTTFFARVLNAHPNILCGQERFNNGSLSPDHLSPEGFRTRDLDRKTVNDSLRLLEEKSSQGHVIFGDKLPRAYMNLEDTVKRFHAAGRGLKLIVLLRDIEYIANSWYRRANNVNDMSWDRGMFGVFPYIEQVFLARMLSTLASPEDCLLISYTSLFDHARRNAVMDAVAAHLGVEDAQPFITVMDGEATKTRKIMARDRSADPVHFHSDHLFFGKFPEITGRNGFCKLSVIQTELRQITDDIVQGGSFVQQAIDHIQSETSPEIIAYQKKIRDLYKWGMKGLDLPFDQDILAALDDTAAVSSQTLSENQAILSKKTSETSGATLYFDVTDLFNFVARHKHLTGIQRVTLEAVRALTDVKCDATCKVLLLEKSGWHSASAEDFVRYLNGHENIVQAIENFEADKALRAETEFTASDVVYFLGAPWTVPNFFRSLGKMRLCGARLVFYIHDVLPVEVPEFFEAFHVETFEKYMQTCLFFASGILCNSEETRASLFAHFDYGGPTGVVDLNLAPDFISKFAALPAEEKISLANVNQELAEREFVLMVGTLEPRKNYVTALNVWATLCRQLKDECPILVIVGKKGWMSNALSSAIADFPFPDKILHLTNVEDNRLASLYQRTKFLLSLSRREGWELSVTEALASGSACVAGNTSCAQAARQGVVCTVDELSERDVLEKITNLLVNKEKMIALQTDCSEQPRFKTWSDFTNDVIAFKDAIPRAKPTALTQFNPNTRYEFGHTRSDGSVEATQDGRKFLFGLGWNPSDSWGCWSKLDRADLMFSVSEPGKYSFMAILTTTPANEQFEVSVRCGDDLKWKGRLFPHRCKLVMMDIDVTERDGAVDVSFVSAPPKDFGDDPDTAEMRTLGFALIEAQITPKSDFEGRASALERLIARYL